MGSSQISLQKLLAASNGNSDLYELLTQMAQGKSELSAVTGTTPVAGQTPGVPNPAAAIPPQATGVVSILGGAYIVQITNPGASNPISALQAAQQGDNATSLTPLQPVTPIFHQIRVSTSPAFNVNSNTQTFGGNTGSTQTYWTLTGLGTGTWFVQFRSSYDGVNFNTWRNANGGTALGGLINEVTEENVGNANWALFKLPGSLVMGIGQGFCTDGEIFSLAQQVFSSGMMAIATPNGFSPTLLGSTFGVTKCDVDLQIPSTGGAGIVGIPDFPVEIRMVYGEHGSSTVTWPGDASVLAFAFDPTNENVKIYNQPGGTTSWAEMRLPGGARIAIGQGNGADGTTIWTPGLTWMSSSRMISICSLTDATDSGFIPEGFYANQLTGFTIAAQYKDISSNIWSTSANWLAICWQAGVNILTFSTGGGGTWIEIPLQGGHAVYIGAGGPTPAAAAPGFAGVITLPPSSSAFLGICTPNGTIYNPANLSMTAVQSCYITVAAVPELYYVNTGLTPNFSSGSVNWMIGAWK